MDVNLCGRANEDSTDTSTSTSGCETVSTTTTDSNPSSPSSPSSSSSGGETSEGVKSTVSFSGDSGDKKSLSFSKDVGLTELVVNLRDAVDTAMITVQKLNEKPSEISEPSNPVYDYIKIVVTDSVIYLPKAEEQLAILDRIDEANHGLAKKVKVIDFSAARMMAAGIALDLYKHDHKYRVSIDTLREAA